MKVLFIGLGSIAGRHIRNLKSIMDSKVAVTVMRSGKGKEVSSELLNIIDHIVFSDSGLEDKYDVIFITNPTSLHYKTLEKYHNMSGAFFIEKPVFELGTENIDCLQCKSKIYYVACPLRYTNVIQWVRENIDFTTVHSMRAISSSYLPEWRPGIDYRGTYSSHKDMGGGVSIDLIHEWDYITYLIGFPNNVKSIISKKSDLEIDSDDIATYIAEYEDKIVEVHLDYFGRKAIRKLELFTDEDTIVADLINQRINWMISGRSLNFAEDRDSYQKKELIHFLDIMDGKVSSDNTIEDACKVLRIARGIE